MFMISTDVVAHDELVQPIMPHFAQKSPCTLRRGAVERMSSVWVSGAGERCSHGEWALGAAHLCLDGRPLRAIARVQMFAMSSSSL